MTWHHLGTNENDSMPLGNGDLALNVWTETNGDLVLLAAKSDAWSENGQLLKLGRVRLEFSPNPFTVPGAFAQTLKLESGEVQISSGKNLVRIWVDANHLVAHVEVETESPVGLVAKSECWRTKAYHLDPKAVQQAGFFEWGNNPDGLDFDPDTRLPAQNNQIAWCHFNTRSIYPLVFAKEHLEMLLPKFTDPLWHRCFGMAMKGDRLASDGDQGLQSTRDANSFQLDLYALTQQSTTPERWRATLDQVVTATDGVSLNAARRAHRQWWADFWSRSWIRVSGTPEAEQVAQSYAMQRYLTACAGRGAQPVKFNGSLFCVGHDLPAGATSSESNHDPDYRAWGASYWNQNTRLVYWPLMAAGDSDLLAPWFNMYVAALPLARARTQTYFHHDGAAFIETLYFWGLPNVNDFGWNNPGPELQSEWMRYHIQGGLELLAQMLDRYVYTQDDAFAQDSLVPLADAVITFFPFQSCMLSGKTLME